MKKYKYNGKVPVYIPGFGVVKPKEIIKVKELNHPLFQEVKKETKK